MPPAEPQYSVIHDGLEIDTRMLGGLPLIRALIVKLGIDDVLNKLLPKDPRSRVSDTDCVVAMIANVLHGRCALYCMSEFFEHIDTAVLFGSDIDVSADAFNDNRLASCLDHLFEAGTDTVLADVVHQFLTAPTETTPSYSVHADGTSLSLHGAYDREPVEGAPRPARGFSKDHRPDLKQLVYGMVLHGATQVPLVAMTLDGNTSDKDLNRWSVVELASQLPEEHDVTIVADSKMVDADVMGRLLDEGFHFVSLVPRTYSVRNDLVERARTAGEVLPELASVRGRRKTDPDLIYRGRSFHADMKIVDPHTKEVEDREMTLLVVYSDAQALKFANSLDKKLVKEEAGFASAVKRVNRRGPRCLDDARVAMDDALQRLKFQCCELKIVAVEVKDKRTKRGRPKKGEKPPVHTEYHLEYDQLERDQDAIDKAAFHAAHFVLVTDRMDWDDKRIHAEYRHQSTIEGHSGFRWLKNEAVVAPIFLHTPHRIAALGLVFVLALMVRNYLQFEIRRRLAEEDQKLRGRKRNLYSRTATPPQRPCFSTSTASRPSSSHARASSSNAQPTP